jgi:NAD(P)-dependent dehydrogenase (short-subunit alcohol dehydrogenase family)
VVTAQADIRDAEALRRLLNEAVTALGHLDIVVANAGIATPYGEGAQKLSSFNDAIDIMLKGTYTTIETALPALLDHKRGGAIAITSSAAALKSLFPSFRMRNHGAAGYTAAKAAINGLMLYYARTLAERAIRVNAVLPSAVATPMAVNDAVSQTLNTYPEWGIHTRHLLPVQLLGTSDITEAMLFLCANSGRHITGTSLVVDAGWSIG